MPPTRLTQGRSERQAACTCWRLMSGEDVAFSPDVIFFFFFLIPHFLFWKIATLQEGGETIISCETLT